MSKQAVHGDNTKYINIYSPLITKLIRIFSIFAASFLIFTNLHILYTGEISFYYNNKEVWKYITVSINFISIIFIVLVAIFPKKLGFISVPCFIYAVIILVFEPDNQMGSFMFLLGIEILHIRGYFIKKKFLKNSIAFGIYLLLVLTELQFGFSTFLVYLLNKIAYLIIMFANLFCCIFYYHFFYEKKSDNSLNLKEYPDLNARDSEWLIMIQNHKTYKEIASTYNITEGTVRNRMNKVYKILEVGDKQGFKNLYSEYKISFGEAVSENTEEPHPMNQDEQQNLA